jgi:chromate transporter
MLHQIVDVRSWMDAPTFLDGIALGQVTPGPIVITATFVGYLLHGPIGGVVATLSVFLPSFVIVVGIAPYFDRLRSSPYFHKGVGGILCSFVGLLFTVAVRFGANMPWDVPRIGLAAAALAALLLRVDILWVVLAGTIISIFCF